MTQNDKSLYVAISLDIDSDANSAVEGRHDAISSPIEDGEIRVDACKKGLQKIFELLEKYDIDATLFYEARTAQMLIESGMYLPKLSERHEIACHSLKHEDFLGKVSGIPMEEKSIEESIYKAKEILVKIFGQEIKGFRAPYTRINRTVVKVLERLGFQYDSSETVTLGTEWAGNPYPLKAFDSSLMELALPSFRDAKGKKMSSYLWAIFEGRRVFGEYIDAVVQARDIAKQGLFVFSIHPWHLYVDCRGNQFGKNQARKNLENLESLFFQIKQMQGIRILRQDKYMENWL
jgi:peptidoglycan/xylan/chitin deacetylase (PgdA/CDA1 family)